VVRGRARLRADRPRSSIGDAEELSSVTLLAGRMKGCTLLVILAGDC
jgi:hypothetical protein